ncbi:MAG TPA: hypothetical protein VFL80_11540, partial [Thermoanaerobaculia bacterium]|nr:hypothetical protein [Thermoanaerobaculia bacterium]
MKKPSTLSLLFLIAGTSVLAQTDITTTIDPSRAAAAMRIAIPFPQVPPPVSADVIREGFFAPLTRDLAGSGVFAIAPLPPNIPIGPDLAKRSGAHVYLKLNVSQEGETFLIEARLLDTTGAQVFGKRYRGASGALSRIGHTLANDLVRTINGRPGIFLSQIAFASNRDGNWEIYLMDWDGSNQRRITRHGALSILPSWAPDNERMVYTSFARGTSDMYVISRQGGGRIRVHTGLGLNTSATFSPISNEIAFVGSLNGNPDIYV